MIVAALLVALALPLPEIPVIDENGQVRSTAEWRGTPTIVAPLYTRCPLACPLIAQGLKRGVAEASANPASYRVVLFSFDPRDTPADLRRFRERFQIPLAWTIVATRGNDARRLLDAAGYRYGDAGGYFTHPSAVIVLTPGLVPATTLYGTKYDVDAALAVASGSRDWMGRYGGWLLALLLFLALLAVVYLLTLLNQARSASRDVRHRPADVAAPRL